MMLTRSALMTLLPRLCRLAGHPDVQPLLPAAPDADMQPLALALLRLPQEARPVLAAMTGVDEISLGMLPAGASLPLMQCCLEEGLAAWLHLCAQCTADELLSALARCAFDPDAATLSALVSRDRNAHARQVYGLQLLWRMLGDDRLPDAMSLFQPARREEASHG